MHIVDEIDAKYRTIDAYIEHIVKRDKRCRWINGHELTHTHTHWMTWANGQRTISSNGNIYNSNEGDNILCLCTSYIISYVC